MSVSRLGAGTQTTNPSYIMGFSLHPFILSLHPIVRLGLPPCGSCLSRFSSFSVNLKYLFLNYIESQRATQVANKNRPMRIASRINRKMLRKLTPFRSTHIQYFCRVYGEPIPGVDCGQQVAEWLQRHLAAPGVRLVHAVPNQKTGVWSKDDKRGDQVGAQSGCI